MKKKFVLTLALVLMVVVGLSAATPVELSGEFNAGRIFRFEPKSVGASTYINLDKFSVSSDFWKISIDKGTLDFGNKVAQASVDIFLDKALAEQGVDMGEVSLTLSVGTISNSSILSVYADPNDSIGDGLQMKGVLANGTTALTVGYADMVTVKAALNFDTVNTPFVLSANVAPLEGVEATVGYTNYAVVSGAVTGAAAVPGISPAVIAAAEVLDTKGGIGGSFKVDVAALAGIEDFALSASVYDKYLLDTKKNSLYIALEGGYADISADAEFVMAAKNDLKLNASYKGIENVGISAGLQLKDLSDIKTVISGAVDYTMGGVKYKLAAKLDNTMPATYSKFSLTPSVTIKF